MKSQRLQLIAAKRNPPVLFVSLVAALFRAIHFPARRTAPSTLSSQRDMFATRECALNATFHEEACVED